MNAQNKFFGAEQETKSKEEFSVSFSAFLWLKLILLGEVEKPNMEKIWMKIDKKFRTNEWLKQKKLINFSFSTWP